MVKQSLLMDASRIPVGMSGIARAWILPSEQKAGFWVAGWERRVGLQLLGVDRILCATEEVADLIRGFVVTQARFRIHYAWDEFLSDWVAVRVNAIGDRYWVGIWNAALSRLRVQQPVNPISLWESQS